MLYAWPRILYGLGCSECCGVEAATLSTVGLGEAKILCRALALGADAVLLGRPVHCRWQLEARPGGTR